MKIRRFLGLEDREIDKVVLYSVFPYGLITVTSSVELEDRWPVVIEGPEFQLDFLKPLILKMVKLTPEVDEFGTWIGLNREHAQRLNLFYQYGHRLCDRIELLEYKFRRDIVSYANVRLSERTRLEVICQDDSIFETTIGLPEGIKNGEIDIPSVIWQH